MKRPWDLDKNRQDSTILSSPSAEWIVPICSVSHQSPALLNPHPTIESDRSTLLRPAAGWFHWQKPRICVTFHRPV